MRRILTAVFLLLAFTGLAFGITITTQPSLPTAQIGNSYQIQLAATGYSGTPLWSLISGNLPPGFAFDSSDTNAGGTICVGTQSGPVANCGGVVTSAALGSWVFTVRVFDSQNQNNTTTQQFNLVVLTANPPNITSTSPLPNAVVGQPYSFQFQAQGGAPPLSWLEFSPPNTFPASFTLSSGGLLASAQVSQADFAARSGGLYTFTVQVKDANGAVSTARQFSLTITQGLTITTNSPLPSGTVNVPYQGGSGLQLGVTGGSGSYSWQLLAGNLSGIGLSLTSSGLITGTPSSAINQLQFTVQVTDLSTQTTATKTFVISIVSSTLTIVQTSLPNAFQNQSYSTTLTAQGGQSPYTWSLGSNSVSGLSIGATTGVLSGTPTNAPGSYAITVVVQDSAAGTYQATFTLNIASNLTITTKTLPNGTQNQAYSQTVSAGGGQGPYGWSLAAGSLPPGLQLQSSTSSSVTIGGTPTSNGVYQFTVKVVDAESPQQSATQALQIQVGGNVNITTTTLPDGSQGVTYNQVVGATGGQTPYTWTVSSGTLPAGLSLVTNADFTASITGTPTGQGPSQFTLQVTDAQRNTATQTYTINIGVPLTITTSSVANGTVGVAYSQPLGASGGTPPYSWSILSGTLPGGVSLNPGNGLLSGTPNTSGNYSFTVQVRDSGGATAQRAYSLRIISQLSLSTGTFNGQVGSPFSLTLAASGGTSPYSFVIQSGSLPPGVTFNGQNGTFGGTPTAGGTYSVAVVVTDASGSTATATITITITLNTPPTLTIAPIAPTPAGQPALSLTLAGTFSTDLTGTVVLTFLSSVGGDDLTVGFTNGSRTATFTIPAGSSRATFPTTTFGVRTGTVAGTITIAVSSLSAGGTPVTPIPSTAVTIVIPPSPPVITAVSCASSSGGFTVSVTGYTTTRNMVSGTFNFTAASGGSLSNGSGSIVVQLQAPFQTWFSNSAANATGGQFTLTMPFTISAGSATGIGVSVGLANSSGGSNIPAAVNCS